MRRITFAQVTAEECTAALNRVFEQYVIPFALTPEQFALHVICNDVDLKHSPLWQDDAGNVVAGALLAVRERRGWVGGFGVVPEHRGAGVAKQLLDATIAIARERGLQTLDLEALSENAPALALYGSRGFSRTRRLLTFEVPVTPGQPMPPGFAYASPDDLIEAPEAARPCWQREPATHRHGAADSAVRNGGIFALYRFNEVLAQVSKAAASDPQELALLVQAIAAEQAFARVVIANEPEESAIAAFAARLQWRERFFQYEMRLEL